VVPQATLGEAGLSGRLRLIVQPGKFVFSLSPIARRKTSCKSWLAAWGTSQPPRTIFTSSSAACMKLDEVPGGSIYVDTNILYMYLRADPAHLSILTTFFQRVVRGAFEAFVGIPVAELELYYDKFEYVAGVSGKAGNLQGSIRSGGNPFEAPRQREYPLPPLEPGLAGELFAETAKHLGYAPFPRPTANASQAYTNADGTQLGACQYCGFCGFFGCAFNAKGSPHITVIPLALQSPHFTLRTHAWVTRVLTDATGKRATGVAYTHVCTGEEYEQPASLVVLCAYAINNVHLMLLSGIGTPYDPVAQTGGHRQELLLPDRQRRRTVFR